MILRAAVIAGGRGSRLGARTQSLPKPLLPIGGRPLLARVLGRLADEGFREVFLALGYRAGAVRRAIGDGSRFGLSVRYILEPRPLGTAGPLALLPGPLEGPLLVVNGDILTTASLSGMVGAHLRRRADVTVAVVRHRVGVPYSVVRRRGSRLLSIVEKPSLEVMAGAGIYVVNPSVLRRIPRGRRMDFPDLVLRVLGRGRVACHEIRGQWIDIGTPGDYARAQRLFG